MFYNSVCLLVVLLTMVTNIPPVNPITTPPFSTFEQEEKETRVNPPFTESPGTSSLKKFLLSVDEQMNVDMEAEAILQNELKVERTFKSVDVSISRNGSTVSQHSNFTFSSLENVLLGRKNRPNVIKVDVAVKLKKPPLSLIPDLVDIGFGSPKRFCEDDCPCNDNDPYRTADGHCNNLEHSRWGMMSIAMRRWLQPLYDDGVSAPRQKSVSGGFLPSARKVSTTVHLPSSEDDQHAKFTHMLMQWGQFIDHDFANTPNQHIPDGPYTTSVACCARFFFHDGGVPQILLNSRPQCFPIFIPDDDRHFKFDCMNFVRSVQVPNEKCNFAPVEQLNGITAYIDASQVYGSSQKEQNELRTFMDGKLNATQRATEKDDHLPAESVVPQTCPLTHPMDFCFFAGDRRVNENPTLQSMHTIFMRMHNLIAKRLKELNCHWNDERLFQESRKIIGAIMQVITYKEFLPIILGTAKMNEFDLNVGTGSAYSNSYNSTVDASLRNAFATAAFRFGHSMIRSKVSSFDKNYINLGSDNLSDVLGSTHPILSVVNREVGHYARGLVEDCVQNVDCKMTTEVTDHLFEDGTGEGLDLAALNVQRGRDHGLPPYNKWREFCDIPAAPSFIALEDTTHSTENVKKLSSVYEDVDDIDLFSGGLTERPVAGGLVGPTFACLLGRQFKALKEGDRFWFEEGNENVKFTNDQVEMLRRITLSHVLCFATDTMSIQPNAFMKGDPIHCDDLEKTSLDPWIETLGDWTNWSPWGSCEDGLQTRTRECKPCCGCKGPNVSARSCNEGPCGWSPWSYWSQCKHDHVYRTRVCRCPGCSTEVDKCDGNLNYG